MSSWAQIDRAKLGWAGPWCWLWKARKDRRGPEIVAALVSASACMRGRARSLPRSWRWSCPSVLGLLISTTMLCCLLSFYLFYVSRVICKNYLCSVPIYVCYGCVLFLLQYIYVVLYFILCGLKYMSCYICVVSKKSKQHNQISTKKA